MTLPLSQHKQTKALYHGQNRGNTFRKGWESRNSHIQYPPGITYNTVPTSSNVSPNSGDPSSGRFINDGDYDGDDEDGDRLERSTVAKDGVPAAQVASKSKVMATFTASPECPYHLTVFFSKEPCSSYFPSNFLFYCACVSPSSSTQW